MKNHRLRLISAAAAVALVSGFSVRVSPTEAFSIAAPSRGGPATATGATSGGIGSPSLRSALSNAGRGAPHTRPSTSLDLFPFSRTKRDEMGGIANSGGKNNKNKNNKPKALQRRLSDDYNEDNDDVDDEHASESNGNESPQPERTSLSSRVPGVDALVQLVSLRMRRVSFLSWWSQVILTVISAVTLLFTRNVLNLEGGGATAATKALLPNYFLAGSSIGLSIGSIFWTWASRRLARRLLRKPTTRVRAANMLRKSIAIGTCLNLLGMAVAILGAEQIVGGLAIKVLTTSSAAQAVYQGPQAANLLQPLDILVVQANTNTLFSHFCSVVAYLFLSRSIGQLDPPSVEGDERPRA